MYIMVNKQTRAVECVGDEFCPWNEETQDRIVSDYWGGFFKPVYDDKTGEVKETATAEEIAAILHPPREPSREELLAAQVEELQAQMDILTGVKV